MLQFSDGEDRHALWVDGRGPTARVDISTRRRSRGTIIINARGRSMTTGGCSHDSGRTTKLWSLNQNTAATTTRRRTRWASHSHWTQPRTPAMSLNTMMDTQSEHGPEGWRGRAVSNRRHGQKNQLKWADALLHDKRAIW